MNFQYLTLLFTLIFTSASWSFKVLAAPENRVLQITTQNLQCKREGLKKRLKGLAHYLEEKGEVLLLQEVCLFPDLDPLEFLLNKIPPHYQAHSITTHLAWGRYPEGLALVAPEGLIKDAIKGYLPRGVFRRAYLGVRTPLGWIVTTHLSHKSLHDDVRMRQFQKLANIFQNKPAIIGGDFNTSPLSSSAAPLRVAGFKAHFPAPTYPRRHPYKSLDGLWSNLPSLTAKAAVHEIIRSDHLAVTFTLP